ncbi:MAG TPA: type I secretion system permease/ATPase [Alphaproteobacteria bacterium]|jgi:ATP-binding cassette subfamily C protein
MTAPSSELARVLRGWRGAFVGIGVFSAIINVLTLTGAFYMLQVYDRVIPSRSIPTLVGISILAVALFSAHGFLEFIRGRILLRIGRSLDEQISPRVFTIIARLPLTRQSVSEGLQPLRDLDQIRNFFASGGPIAFFDLPWLPFYLVICFAFHPWLGYAAIGGAVVLSVLTLLIEVFTKMALRTAADHGAVRNSLAEASRRNAEVLAAMGMTLRIAAIWNVENQKHMVAHSAASDIAGALSGASKIFRIALQSGVLGLGAYLAIYGEASPGIIIASSIISARALAPVDTAIGNWKGFVAARQSWHRLAAVLATFPEERKPLALRKPERTLSVEGLSVAPPGEKRHVIRNVSFQLQCGSALGVIGPTAAGKSTLARAIIGIWAPAAGCVRLDAAALDQWSPDALGCHIGYLPQDIELFDGTVGQNIARFAPEPEAETVIAAAEAAGVHQMVLRLPKGYETRIGEGGFALSAGQRQRVALARALYGEPFLVVLDEPNANLDAEGEQALTNAIIGVRNRGGIAVIVAHRPNALAAVDMVLMMNEGEVQAFGPQEEVLRKVLRPVGKVATPAMAGA